MPSARRRVRGGTRRGPPNASPPRGGIRCPFRSNVFWGSPGGEEGGGRGNPKTFAPRSGVYSGLRLRGGAYLFENLRAAGTKGDRSGQVRRSGRDSRSSHKASGEADERRPGSLGGHEEAGPDQAGPSSGRGERLTRAGWSHRRGCDAVVGEWSISKRWGHLSSGAEAGAMGCSRSA